MSELITNYVESLRRALSFDRGSADRLADEALDHLHEAFAHDIACPSDEAARRAIRRFGTPREIVAAYTAQIFPEQLRITWRSGVFLGGLVILTMWFRRAFNLLPPIDQSAYASTLLIADSVGFRVAIVAGVCGWLLSLNNNERRHAPLIAHILVAGAAALGLSVAASLVIALKMAVASGWSSAALIPMSSTLLTCTVMAPLLIRIRALRGYAILIDQGGSPHGVE